jgi:hypothetical protein
MKPRISTINRLRSAANHLGKARKCPDLPEEAKAEIAEMEKKLIRRVELLWEAREK